MFQTAGSHLRASSVGSIWVLETGKRKKKKKDQSLMGAFDMDKKKVVDENQSTTFFNVEGSHQELMPYSTPDLK